MKRIALAVISTLAALVALFSYPTSTGRTVTTVAEAVSPATVLAEPGTSSATTTGQGPDPTTPSTTPSSSTPQSSSAPAAAGPVTVDGAAEMTRYGAVQVQVLISGGKITDVIAVQYPQEGGRDQEINSQAIPLLHDQVLSAQSAQVDGVSGATFTSEGYLASVQSALDAAGFGK